MNDQSFSIRLPAQLRAGLDAWAREIDRKPAWLVRRILTVALAEHDGGLQEWTIEVSAVADDGAEEDV